MKLQKIILSVLMVAWIAGYAVLMEYSQIWAYVLLAVGGAAFLSFALVKAIRTSRREREAVQGQLELGDFSCIELRCSLPIEKMRKHEKTFTIQAVIYPKELDVGIAYRAFSLASTEEEDAEFAKYTPAFAYFTISDLAQFSGRTFIMKESLYLALAQFEASKPFFLKNDILRITNETL